MSNLKSSYKIHNLSPQNKCSPSTLNLRHKHSSIKDGVPFATAHTFCASGDGLRKSSLKQRYFCAAYKFAGNADLGKVYWDPKRKLGVTTLFSEIIKLQFGGKMPYIALYLSAF